MGSRGRSNTAGPSCQNRYASGRSSTLRTACQLQRDDVRSVLDSSPSSVITYVRGAHQATGTVTAAANLRRARNGSRNATKIATKPAMVAAPSPCETRTANEPPTANVPAIRRVRRTARFAPGLNCPRKYSGLRLNVNSIRTRRSYALAPGGPRLDCDRSALTPRDCYGPSLILSTEACSSATARSLRSRRPLL
jgi:hypothetical protein